MQVTELKSKGLKKSYQVVIEANAINKQTEAELKAAGERVKIPGFRPGFIPMKVLQARYGKSVQADVIKKVINKSSSDLIAEKKFRPAMTPNVNVEKYEEGGDLTYTIEFETFPPIPELAFEKISLDRDTFEVSEEDIDERMQQIAERNPKLARAKEGSKAQMGQVIFLDFTGSIDGTAFEGGSANDYRLELGSKQFIDDFEEQLVGLKEGAEKTVSVTFPDNYPTKSLAGKDADFAVRIKEIYAKETPQIDDEFAKQRNFSDVKALREVVRSQMVREYDQMVRGQLKKQLFDVLEEEYDFELPQNMVDLEFNTIWERLKQAQAEGDAELAGRSDDDLQDEYRQIAERRVKLGILLAEVGNRHKLQVTSEELNRALMQQVSMFPGQEKKVMEFYHNNPDRVHDLRGPLMEEKAVDFILTKVKFKDNRVSLKDLSDADEASGGDSEAKKKKASAKKARKEEKPKTSAKKKSAGE